MEKNSDDKDIKTAELIPGTLIKTSEGINNTHVCSVLLDGIITRVFVKPLSEPKRVIECFCAVLLRKWGLNVPESALVGIGDEVWFGSIDAAYPSLSRRFFTGAEQTTNQYRKRLAQAIEAAASLPDVPRAIACDEAIANHDRNLGNILWDGEHTAWIDHESAIEIKTNSINKLVAIAVQAGDFIDTEHAAIEFARTLNDHMVRDAVKSISKSDGCAKLVRYRLKDLAHRIIQQFPEPEHDLFGTKT